MSDIFEIRQSTLEDLPVLMNLYAAARKFMADHGNPTQWANGYPSEEMVKADIACGGSRVCCVDDRIVGTFFYQFGEDPNYLKIEGSWLNDEPYGVVHRITSDGSVKGIGSYCLNWAVSQCGNLKIDTHRDNTVMQNTLAKNGFTYCGVIRVRNGEERIAYQKKI